MIRVRELRALLPVPARGDREERLSEDSKGGRAPASPGRRVMMLGATLLASVAAVVAVPTDRPLSESSSVDAEEKGKRRRRY